LRNESELRRLVAEHGQEHIFTFWDDLRSSERAALLAQLERIDFDTLTRAVRSNLSSRAKVESAALEAERVISLDERENDPEGVRREREARERGEEALRSGELAAFVVAGGQGSRLGWEAPKGTFPIGPVTKRTLFDYFGEQILAATRRYGVPIPWLVMTSEENHEATLHEFTRRDWYGLGRENVRLFSQDTIPAVDVRGRVLLAEKHRVFTNPNGHGGSLKALWDSGTIDTLRQRGIRQISYFQVDNPLVPVCDPAFIGHHLLADAEMSSKVVRKSAWDERVGVVGRRGGRLTVIEYSDLPEDLAKQCGPDGRMLYWAGSIAIHALAVDFVRRLNEHGFALPFHVAHKRIAHIARDGHPAPDAEAHGIKFESFVFDALGEARASVTLEVRRADEFSPVKNPSGIDSVESCRRDLTLRALRWLEQAGASVERGPDARFPGFVELSPLWALDAEDAARRTTPGTVIRPGLVLETPR
jgi:UDP-N-acetylglucosamine/UDP-N-acetylgalactosamine diphosphorylase